MLPIHLRRAAALILPLVTAAPVPAQVVDFEPGDTLCLLGGALAERMQHHGWLEVELQRRATVRVRNLGFGADTTTVHQRIVNFGKVAADGMAMNLPNQRFVPWDRFLDHCDADVVLAFFGYNESFAGTEGLEPFRGDLETFVDHVLAQRYHGERAPRLVLFSSIPQEDTGDPNLPDGRAHNERIEAYNAVAAEVAAAKQVGFVDLYGPMAEVYAANRAVKRAPLTINGIHLTEEGNRLLARVIVDGLLPDTAARPGQDVTALRAAVLEKDLNWFHRYRATDGYNVHGGRSRQVYTASESGELFPNFDVLQREMDYLDGLVARMDERIWALARGEDRPVDRSGLPPLIQVETNKRGAGPGGRHVYLDGEAAVEQMTAAPGMKINLFADEVRFPDLINPVQMAWDPAGRLWVLVWPNYPRWTAGRPMSDKVLVFEDTDGDGRADQQTVFADDLVNPTGIEHWNGGVFVACCPDLLFLKDTDGDGRADVRERVLHGLSSGDTHHSSNSFVLGPDGALYFQEGTFHQTQVESIYGPVRNHDGCVWRYEPRTHRVERYIPYNYANPHGHVFDGWGQDFMTDGTGNVNYYALAFSGHLEHPDKHRGYFPFFQQRSRPCAATEMLYSRHFPAQNQGAYLVANVIGFRGIFQYEVVDDGAGFGAVEMDPIVSSTDLNFRPADIEVGPDGAIYFLDWHNAIIGHLQHHIRDPSRDAEHGRIYRVTYEGRPLLERAPIAGQPIVAVLEHLRSPEYRTRYAARVELSGRDSDQVVAAARRWAAGLDASDPDHVRHLLEVLWLHQQHNRMDRDLLLRLLRDQDPRARAAATRVLRYGRQHVSDPLDLLSAQAADPHPRVRLEAVVAASFFESAQAASVALESLRHPGDKYLDYALAETMRALAPYWKAALREGQVLAAGNPAGVEFLLDQVGPDELVNLPRVPAVLQALLARHGVHAAERMEAAEELARQRGTTPLDEVLVAIQRLDQGDGQHAAHVLNDLGALVLASVPGPDAPHRGALIELATQGRKPATRALGYAAWIALDGSADAAWSAAAGSIPGVEAFLGGAPRVQDAALRASLHGRLRPLMFGLPADLAAQVGARANSGTGLELSYYQPPPPDARLETFEARAPRSTMTATEFGLALPADRPDAFGLLFRGTLFVPTAGEYTFYTNSDDGSRLYVDGAQVVDNDGAHGMRERSGKVALGAGPHPIVVTWYDQSGGEGLVVSWQGPDFGKQPIPPEVLGSDPAAAIRARAIRAMAEVPGHGAQKLRDAARFIGEGTLLDPAMELVRVVPREEREPDLVRGVLDALAGHVAGLPPEGRTAAGVLAALEVGRGLAGALPEAEAAQALERLEGLGGSVVLMRTLPHQMLYDVIEFWVEAGEPVSIVFQNNDVMPHNLVVTAPGQMAAVGQAAELFSARPEAQEQDFVPDLDAVLWHSRLLLPGQSQRVTFEAPATPGDHPFLCTYPGHWRVMNGVMHVVPELEGGARVAKRASSEAAAPARDFVRDWTLADLAPLLVEGWERGRSTERGRTLFHEAGCIKCHLVEGEGAIGGPELTKIREKYRGVDLLQHIVEPSFEVLEEYRFTIFETEDGIPVTGRVVEQDELDLHIVTALLAPDQITLLARDEVVARHPSKLSPMPTGLLVTFSEAEVLDLLSFLQAPDER